MPAIEFSSGRSSAGGLEIGKWFSATSSAKQMDIELITKQIDASNYSEATLAATSGT